MRRGCAEEQKNLLQDPVLWTRQHKLAWIIMSLVGALAGVLGAFIRSPTFCQPQTSGALAAWLADPRGDSIIVSKGSDRAGNYYASTRAGRVGPFRHWS